MAFGDASDPFLIKENDTRPRLPYYVQQGEAVPVPMTDASSVVFNMRMADSPNTVIVDRETAEIVAPAAAGLLRYTFTAAETATPGDYIGEFEITFSDGGILTVPTGDKYIHIKVGDDIA